MGLWVIAKVFFFMVFKEQEILSMDVHSKEVVATSLQSYPALSPYKDYLWDFT